jgi:hypothetical protein
MNGAILAFTATKVPFTPPETAPPTNRNRPDNPILAPHPPRSLLQ